MKKEPLIIISSFLFGMLVWVSDSALDSLFFYDRSFVDMFIADVPKHEIFFRVEVVFFFTIFGVIIAQLFSKADKAQTALQKANAELENKVENRTIKLSQANAILNGEIAERVHTEYKLQQNQKMLQAVFDGISEPLILVDMHYEIKLLNRSAYAYYGIESSQNVKDKKCHEIALANSNPCAGCDLHGSKYSAEPTSFERAGIFNSQKVEKVVTYPILGEKGHIENILIRISDITDRKNFERHLVQSEKMSALGILVSSVAHEINNPNNFVTFNIPILKDYILEIIPILEEYANNHPDYEPFNMPIYEFIKDLTRIIDNIDHGSKRVSTFVSNLKDYSQQDYDAPQTLLDIRTAIENSYMICKSKIEREVKSFSMEIPDNLPQVLTDRYAVEQVLVTLLINATEAVDKQDSWIKVTAREVNGRKRFLEIKVQDNGSGMDENTKRRIFDPFFSTKAREVGTGLGLYICHNLSKKLGAKIEVESEPNIGTVFRLNLPFVDKGQLKHL